MAALGQEIEDLRMDGGGQPAGSEHIQLPSLARVLRRSLSFSERRGSGGRGHDQVGGEAARGGAGGRGGGGGVGVRVLVALVVVGECSRQHHCVCQGGLKAQCVIDAYGH